MMPHPATEQVSAHLARAAAAGTDRILIQLHPAELGRVDVRLEIGADGRVAAVITADRQDTLDMLQRDARTLERTLQDSGLKTGGDSLSFGLRGEGRQNPSAEGERGHGQASSAAMALDELAIAPVAARTGPQAPGALDITV